MSTHKYIERICAIATLIVIVLSILFMNAEKFGIQPASQSKEYENTLFDTSVVHTIDIQMDDWDSFLDTCINEEYSLCSLTIDGETYSNVAIRGKGNTSLTQVQNYGNDRYSFKVDFDHYDDSINYYGLDRLCLNNIIQDNTYMKDYLTYQMMDYFGVDAPLSSFAYITVNGEDWGLYVAVEDVTDSFLERNYGNDYGELYKPDSTGNMGGQGGKMQAPEDIGDFTDNKNLDENAGDLQPPTDIEFSPADDTQDTQQAPGGRGGAGGGGGGAMSSDDTLLVYTDDDYDSYSNIFDNAETDITDADKDRLISSLKQLNEGENIDEVVNVDEVIRYFVVHNFVCNFDSYTGSMIHNYYLYEEDGQLSMIPWDYNLAFGGFMGGSDADSLVNYPIDTPVSGLSVEERPMLAWIFSDEEYTELYHAYFAEFISSFFDSGYFEQIMDDVYKLISPYVEKDPTKFCTYDEFVTGFNTLKEFCLLRAESITGQLNGTIPSTSEGQQEDPSSLIDASFISITDMGSQGGNMGGGGGRRENMSDMAGTDDATNNAEGTADNMSADIPFPDASTADLPGDASVPADADGEDTPTVQANASQSPENTQAPGGRVNIQSTVSGTDQQNTSLPKTPSDTAGSGQINTGSEQSQEDSAASSDGLNDTAPEDMQNTDMAPGMNRMAQNGAPAESQNSGSTLVLVIISAVVLAIGILIAALYKR